MSVLTLPLLFRLIFTYFGRPCTSMWSNLTTLLRSLPKSIDLLPGRQLQFGIMLFGKKYENSWKMHLNVITRYKCHHSLIHTVTHTIQTMMKVGLHMVWLFCYKYQNHFLRIPLSYVAKCPVANCHIIVDSYSSFELKQSSVEITIGSK